MSSSIVLALVYTLLLLSPVVKASVQCVGSLSTVPNVDFLGLVYNYSLTATPNQIHIAHFTSSCQAIAPTNNPSLVLILLNETLSAQCATHVDTVTQIYMNYNLTALKVAVFESSMSNLDWLSKSDTEPYGVNYLDGQFPTLPVPSKYGDHDKFALTLLRTGDLDTILTCTTSVSISNQVSQYTLLWASPAYLFYAVFFALVFGSLIFVGIFVIFKVKKQANKANPGQRLSQGERSRLMTVTAAIVHCFTTICVRSLCYNNLLPQYVGYGTIWFLFWLGLFCQSVAYVSILFRLLLAVIAVDAKVSEFYVVKLVQHKAFIWFFTFVYLTNMIMQFPKFLLDGASLAGQIISLYTNVMQTLMLISLIVGIYAYSIVSHFTYKAEKQQSILTDNKNTTHLSSRGQHSATEASQGVRRPSAVPVSVASQKATAPLAPKMSPLRDLRIHAQVALTELVIFFIVLIYGTGKTIIDGGQGVVDSMTANTLVDLSVIMLYTYTFITFLRSLH